ncbi:MAG: SGNH/GDSL hydrolase family protein [Clostridiales bacterium]|nr:SGNH/GDSL hydrolase family protein [Clostridiales bacterium]
MDNGTVTLETYEWDQTWVEHAEDRAAPRVLYIGDSISIPTRAGMNAAFGDKLRVDGFASSKAADHPYFAECVRLFAAQMGSPYRAVLFNNGLHGWHLDDTCAYPLHYSRVVEELRSLFPEAEFCIVLTTPVEDPRQDERVRSRNRSAQRIAGRYGMPTVDLYRADPQLKKYLCPDGVHFTDGGYRILTDTLAAYSKRFI